MGCDVQIFKNAMVEVDFNPRTRMGCDDAFTLDVARADISIHAPAWGATKRSERFPLGFIYFNPRTRMGCDNLARFQWI